MSSSLELVLPTYTGSFVTEEDREWLEESIDERSYVAIEQLMGTAATQPWFAYDDIRIWRTNLANPHRISDRHTKIAWTFHLVSVPGASLTLCGMGVHPDHRQKGHFTKLVEEMKTLLSTDDVCQYIKFYFSIICPATAKTYAARPVDEHKRLFTNNGYITQLARVESGSFVNE